MSTRLKVKGTKDIGKRIHGFRIKKVPESHTQICGLVNSLGLDEDSLLEFDFPYEGIDGEHIATLTSDYRVDLFIAKEYLYLVIERRGINLTKKELIDKLDDYLLIKTSE